MKVRLLDKEELKHVTPADLKNYAESENWVYSRPYGDLCDVYEKKGFGSIVLPRSCDKDDPDDVDDYLVLVSRLIAYWARFRQGDELAVYRDIIRFPHDQIRIRAISGANDDGSIPLQSGVNLFTQAQNMLRSAAKSAASAIIEVKQDINDYMERVRLGQTEQGSFVITLLTPPVPQQYFYDEPFEYQVTGRLAEALASSRQAANKEDKSKREEAFRCAEPKGVSAAFCDIISELTKDQSQIDVNINWAKVRSKPPLPHRTSFTAKDHPIFKDAAEFLRKRDLEKNIQIQGRVYQLKREPGQDQGEIKLDLVIDGENQQSIARLGQEVSAIVLEAHKKKKPVKVTLGQLDQEDYAIALEAHKEKKPVKVTGDLRYKGEERKTLHLDHAKLKPIDSD